LTRKHRFRQPAFLLATWFGVGLLPFASGTYGSLAALPIAALVESTFGFSGLAAVALLILIVGVWAAGVCVREMGEPDPSVVVIDEVAGQLLVLLMVPAEPLLYAAGFLLFRLFDIVKPWPVCWADRRLAGGLGVMLDDVLAAGYAAIALSLLARWLEV
jgi:phosphatidylglycerophosphatase A